MERLETLVVGAGPVGLFLAAELRRRGRECVIIDAAQTPSSYSKALAIMPGTLEMFEQAGIAREFLGEVNRIDGVRFVTPRRSVFVPFGGLRSRYNFVSILPQWKTEELLRARLRELGGEVLFGHTLRTLAQQGDGVLAALETPNGTRQLRARYVAGCDGIHSTVRQQAGIAFLGESYPGTALLADARVHTKVPPTEARVHVHADGVVTMFPMSAQVRRIVLIAPRETLPDRIERDELHRRLRAGGYADVEVEEVLWSNAFRVHRKIAGAMRNGNVFLAGDSVHAHSPVGGQGMNVGLHDAFNLAGKLAAVLAGRAEESLLGSYERERLPIARAVVRRTDVLTRVLVHPHPLLRITRERIAPRIAGVPLVYGPLIRKLSLTA